MGKQSGGTKKSNGSPKFDFDMIWDEIKINKTLKDKGYEDKQERRNNCRNNN